MTDRAPRRVRMREVAERAGVSPTTVSFVLAAREDMRISEGTRQRVLRTAREMGYRPNLISRSLRTSVTQTIGFISRTILTDQYAGDLIRGSLLAAAQHDHLLAISETGDDTAAVARAVEHLLARQADGFILAMQYPQPVRLPRALAGHPVVLLNGVSPSRAAPAIIADDVAGGRTAAASLLAAGHREGIVLVGEHPTHVLPAQERLSGITEALRAAGVHLHDSLDSTWWPEPSFDAVTRYLRQGGEATAFICMNDRVALGVYQALQAAELTIPDDVSVVSFDDSPLASWMRPQLTSIALPYVEMGRRAVDTVLANRPPPDIQRVHMPLRERASVAPPRTTPQPPLPRRTRRP